MLNEIQLKLEKIREFDSLIDFARSSLQLDIVLYLASTNTPQSAADIAKALGQRKKPILDALRKLEIKGLVKRTGTREDLYELTELGRNTIDDLMIVLGFGDMKQMLRNVHRRYGKIQARDMIRIVVPVNYLHDVLVALGTSRTHELPLSSLSQIVGISEQRLSMYLEPYVNPRSEVRLFKKIRKETWKTKIKNILFGTRHTEVFYRLTSLGQETFYRLTTYTKIKNNTLLRYLVRMFGNYSPKYVIRKLSTVSILLAAIALSVVILFPELSAIALSIWSSYQMIIGVLFLLAYK